VFHSAGHDVYSAIGCTVYPGYHDIYHTPADMYGLYLDCRCNAERDWWWGGIDAHGVGDASRHGTTLQPVERRVMDTVAHVLSRYPLDRNRVYAVGNSMGGSGALGLAMNHGDVFASVIANVPAGVEHAMDRCCLGKEKPAGFSIPEPPVVVDYSAQNDAWSEGHDRFYKAMEAEKYALIGYFGPFGHADNTLPIRQVNDLVLTFDALSIKKNEAYPAFTHASTDDLIPWLNDLNNPISGQVNAFFLYQNTEDTATAFAMDIWLATDKDIDTKRTLPTASTADVTLRRIQNFVIRPNEEIHCAFGQSRMTVKADNTGHITLPQLTIKQEKQRLVLHK